MRVAIPTDERNEWDAKIVDAVEQGATTVQQICGKLDVVLKTYDAVVVMRRLQALRKTGSLQRDGAAWSVGRRKP